MKNKPDMGFWKLWNLSFGFFGVQIAYALQSAQVSRIFSTIGADPHDLSFFWILPPLMGMIVQPIVGSASDRTWNRLGRRLPYLTIGAAVAIVVMALLPNAGSLGLGITPTWLFGFSSAIIFGLVMLMLLDTSINMAMQPFKMLVGDMVNDKQKGLAYSIQSFLCNAGSVVGYLLPFGLAMFLANTAPDGQVPATVTCSFYIGAAILMLCVIYSFWKIKEWPPEVYNQYNGTDTAGSEKKEKEKSDGMLKLLVKAPKVFWTVGLVQFFCWAAFLYMWSYSTDAIAGHSFHAPAVETVSAIKMDGTTYALDKAYLFDGQTMLVDHGKATPEFEAIASGSAKPVSSTLTYARIVSHDRASGQYFFSDTEEIPAVAIPEKITFEHRSVLNAASEEYQAAGDWNGVLLAVQGVIAVLWAVVLPRFRNRRTAYSLSLLIGAIGFLSIYVFTNKYMLCLSYGLAGVAWAAMLAMPFTILTSALSGNNIGTYLGLFNCTICFPQIIAALCGGALLSLFPAAANGAPDTVWMLMISGVLLLLGSLAVWNVKERAKLDPTTKN